MNVQIGQEINNSGSAYQLVGNDGTYNKALATQIALKGIDVSQNPEKGLSQTFDAKANGLSMRDGSIGPQRDVVQTMLPPAPTYNGPRPS